MHDFGVNYHDLALVRILLTLYLGEVLCIACGNFETDIRKSDVCVFASVCKVTPYGAMVFTC
jgi:hypothetical protein